MNYLGPDVMTPKVMTPKEKKRSFRVSGRSAFRMALYGRIEPEAEVQFNYGDGMVVDGTVADTDLEGGLLVHVPQNTAPYTQMDLETWLTFDRRRFVVVTNPSRSLR